MRALLLHGFAGDPQAWDAVIAAGLGDLEPIAVRMPGHGAPLRESWAATIDAMEGAQLAIGYSFGARVALGMLARRRVERAILIGVNPGIPNEERMARRAGDQFWVRKLRRQTMQNFVEAWEAQPLFASQAVVSRTILAARRTRRLEMDSEGLARCLEVMGLAEMPDYTSVVDDRCRLIIGELDTKFLAIAKRLRAPLTTIPDAGHDVPLEQPELLAAAIRNAFT